MTAETKKLLKAKGLTDQQINSHVLDQFITIVAEESGVLERETLEKNKVLKRQNFDLDRQLMNLRYELTEAKRVIQHAESLEENIARLEEEVARLRQLKQNELIDDAKVRNFMGMVRWLADNYSEQQIKSFCNIGKGFFGGWIDPPAELDTLKQGGPNETIKRL